MSRGLKIYTAIIGIIIVVVIASLLYEPGDVRDLNAILARDQQLSTYAYQFRVLRVENGTAVMSSPRAAGVSVPLIIRAIDPSLQGVSVTDERYYSAQQRLAELQGHARQLVLADAAIARVKWELDTQWLQSRGIAY